MSAIAVVNISQTRIELSLVWRGITKKKAFLRFPQKPGDSPGALSNDVRQVTIMKHTLLSILPVSNVGEQSTAKVRVTNNGSIQIYGHFF